LTKIPRFNIRLLPVHAGILVTFLLMPVWYRFPGSPRSFDTFYSTGFLIFWPMLWTVVWWLLMGLPGIKSLWRDRAHRWWMFAILGLLLWAFFSSQWSYTRPFRHEVTIGAALPFGLAILFAIVVACAAPAHRYLVTALIIGVVWNSGLTFLQVANQGSIGLRAIGEFRISPENGASVVQAGAVRWLRPYGLLPHPNMLAGFLMISLLAVAAWVFSRRPMKWFAGTVIALSGLFALLLTFSRAAWGGFAIGFVVMLVLAWRDNSGSTRRFLRLEPLLTLGMALIVGIVFVLLFQDFLLARAGINTESIELRSISDRTVYTQFAFRSIRETPIWGLGIGNFPWRTSYYLMFTDYDLRGDNVHNIYLSAWAELGIVGLILMMSAMITGAWAVVRTSTRGREYIERIGQFAGFIALAAIGLLDHYPWTAIQFQAAFWGLLAAAGKPENQN
jgi:O-antigen ligase